VALPCLLEFDCPAVLFMPTDFIGGTNTFDEGIEPTELICSWNDLRALERNNVSVQSHTASHRWLSQLDAATQTEELSRSKAVLEVGLNKRVELLSYPYGDAATNIATVSCTGYRAAFLFSGEGRVYRGPVTDPYRLPRIAVGPDTDLKAAFEAS
jgi:peptidoglycan/xylan/chitin deacetylase (PgdA/CDA1 family)